MNQNDTRVDRKTFLEMPNAAASAGFSLRHFRRIIKDTGIRRVKIGRRFFVIGEDLQRWKSERAAEQSDGN
jgi:hypothetical protein